MRKQGKANHRFEAWDMLQHIFKEKDITDHTMRFVAVLSEKIDVSRLKMAVDLSANAFPLIKSRFHEKKYRPRWEQGSYSADDVVALIDTTDANDDLTRFLGNSVDAYGGPQLKIAVIRSDAADTLCVLINHMLCDAAGFKDFLYMLSENYMNQGQDTPDGRAPAMGSRRIKQVYKALSFRDRMKILVSQSGSPPDTAAFKFDDAAGTPFSELRTIPREQFLSLKTYAKKHTATVNDVFLTAYMRLLFRYFGRTVVLPCVVDLRKYLPNRKAKAFCNLISNLNCDIGPEPGSSFEQTLARVKNAMDKEKSDVSCMKPLVVMEKVFNILPYSLTKSMVEKVYADSHIEFTNIGVIDKTKLIFGQADIIDAYILGSIKYKAHFELSVSTFDNRPTFCVNYSGTPSDREKISLFLDELVDELLNAI